MTQINIHADQFIHHLEFSRRLSPHTVSSYRGDLHLLAEELGDISVADIQISDIRRLLMAARKKNIKPTSIARRLSAWRMFFNYLLENKIVSHNPVSGVRPPKKPARLPRALTPDEAAHFLDEKFSSDDWISQRDTAMFELLYSTGLRVGEMAALDIEDMDFAASLASVRRGKGGRGRTTPFGAAAKTALKKWLVVRKPLVAVGCVALFVNRSGQRLSARTMQSRMAIRAALVGSSKITPHVLRHSCASHFLQSSGDLRATQDLLGHSDIASTQIYTRLDFQNLAATYDRAHPRARK